LCHVGSLALGKQNPLHDILDGGQINVLPKLENLRSFMKTNVLSFPNSKEMLNVLNNSDKMNLFTTKMKY
jgi:hypothetical protein